MPSGFVPVSIDDHFDLETTATGGLTRRAFLAAAAAAGGVAMLPAWVLTASEAFAAPPVGPSEGILVLITLGGGNDGLNTVVPLDQGRYQDLRQNLAVRPEDALPLVPGYGLHPSLTGRQGHVGPGPRGRRAGRRLRGHQPQPLRLHGHLDGAATPRSAPAAARAGWGAGSTTSAGDDPLQAVAIGSSTASTLQGRRRSGTALPNSLSGAFGGDRSSAHDARMFDAVLAFAEGPHRGAHGGDAWPPWGALRRCCRAWSSPAYTDLPRRSHGPGHGPGGQAHQRQRRAARAQRVAGRPSTPTPSRPAPTSACWPTSTPA